MPRLTEMMAKGSEDHRSALRQLTWLELAPAKPAAALKLAPNKFNLAKNTTARRIISDHGRAV